MNFREILKHKLSKKLNLQFEHIAIKMTTLVPMSVYIQEE